jgi:hypothetical protein
MLATHCGQRWCSGSWALGWRRAGTGQLAAGAVAVAFAVECSQLYHAAGIDSIRETGIGALLLGSDFLWSDLLCYAVGVCIAVVLDALLVGRDKHPGDGVPASVRRS